MQLSAVPMMHAANTSTPYSSSARSADSEKKTEEAELLIKLGRLEEASAVVDQLIKGEQGKNPDTLETALYLYQSLGRYEAAIETAENLYRLEPENHALLKTQGEILFQLKQFSDAEEKLKRYHEKVQDDYRSYHLLGDVYAALGRDTESRGSYERALSILQKTKS
ncbi:MAG: tetratricopeptide repeat protein [Candidatus Omnitrophica bacterium]|nr:tetratricopeptide repeat protein [Candidatus Omnitrophota bacterium]